VRELNSNTSLQALRNLQANRYKRITKGNVKFIPSGYPLLEETINDFESGTITIIAGCPGDGKSTIVHGTALWAVDRGKRVMIVDGEHTQGRLINDLYMKVIGYNKNNYDLVRFNNKWIKEPKQHILDQLVDWHKDNLLLYSRNLAKEIDSLDALFTLLELYVKQYKIDYVVLDNMVSLIFADTEDTNKAQSLFIKRVKKLADVHNVAIVLVAHPNKTVQRGEEFEYYQIAGNSDVVNLSDNIIAVWREFDPHKDADGYMAVKKNRNYGTLKQTALKYMEETKTLAEIEGGTVHVKTIDIFMKGEQQWEKTETSPF